jgi:hypothetical protein
MYKEIVSYNIPHTTEGSGGIYIYIYMMKLSLGIFGIFGCSNKVSALAFPSVGGGGAKTCTKSMDRERDESYARIAIADVVRKKWKAESISSRTYKIPLVFLTSFHSMF